jgi:hypothetical protein
MEEEGLAGHLDERFWLIPSERAETRTTPTGEDRDGRKLHALVIRHAPHLTIAERHGFLVETEL